MAIKSTCLKCGDIIYIPKYAEGDFSFCIACGIEEQEKMIVEVPQ